MAYTPLQNIFPLHNRYARDVWAALPPRAPITPNLLRDQDVIEVLADSFIHSIGGISVEDVVKVVNQDGIVPPIKIRYVYSAYGGALIRRRTFSLRDALGILTIPEIRGDSSATRFGGWDPVDLFKRFGHEKTPEQAILMWIAIGELSYREVWLSPEGAWKMSLYRIDEILEQEEHDYVCDAFVGSKKPLEREVPSVAIPTLMYHKPHGSTAQPHIEAAKSRLYMKYIEAIK